MDVESGEAQGDPLVPVPVTDTSEVLPAPSVGIAGVVGEESEGNGALNESTAQPLEAAPVGESSPPIPDPKIEEAKKYLEEVRSGSARQRAHKRR